jgi:hypothetical protein
LQNHIELPCKDSICKEHLVEKQVQKQNEITCKKCHNVFEVKDNEFPFNNIVKQLLDEEAYLTSEEKELKQKLNESIRLFHQMYDDLLLNKNSLDLACHTHFQEIRFQLDEHREKFKENIDDIYMEMIEQTKTFEASYLKSLNESLESKLKSFDNKSLDEDLNEIEQAFRNPNVVIASIQEIELKQQKAIEDIQSKLNEMNQVKVNIKRTNEFKPNASFSKDLFGQINLKNYSNDILSSKILTGNQPSDLLKLCEFSLDDEWTLLYRGTRDGFSAKAFHSKCDNHSNTLTILKAKQSSYIFGGFTSVSWDSSNRDKSDQNAFIFSLTNKDKKPLKMKIGPNEHQSAICCYFSFGSTFGGGHDIYIANSANATMKSFANLGYSYKHPQYAFDSNEAKTFLAGSSFFELDEIEVYQKE